MLRKSWNRWNSTNIPQRRSKFWINITSENIALPMASWVLLILCRQRKLNLSMSRNYVIIYRGLYLQLVTDTMSFCWWFCLCLRFSWIIKKQYWIFWDALLISFTCSCLCLAKQVRKIRENVSLVPFYVLWVLFAVWPSSLCELVQCVSSNFW